MLICEIVNYDADMFRSFADTMKTQYGLHQFDLWLDKSGDIKLGSLSVPRKDEKTGLGNAIMLALCRFADRYGKCIVLSSRHDHDSFYKKFEFDGLRRKSKIL